MSATDQAARRLQDARLQRRTIDSLPGEQLPATPEQGYSIQSSFARLQDEPVAGWKIAATAAAGRAHINVDRPLAGRLFESWVHDDGVVVDLTGNRMRVAEAEFVLRVGRDLLPRPQPYTPDEVAAAVRSLHPGLEIPDSRFTDFTRVGTSCLIADNACASRFVLGAATTARFDPAALAEATSTLWINGAAVTHGVGSDALGGPLLALTWLVNTLSGLDITLAAGQFVTTGVTGKPSPIGPGDDIRVDLGEFGTVGARMR